MILLGIALSWMNKISIGIVGTSSGIVMEVLSYLFFRRLDKANGRMDIYHKELLQIYWLELLMTASAQLPAEKEVENMEFVIRSATRSWGLSLKK